MRHNYLVYFCLALALCPVNSYADPINMPLGSLPVIGNGSENEVENPASHSTPLPAAAAPAAAFVSSGYVEVGGDVDSVSHDYGNWAGEYLKGEVQTDPDNRWNSEVLNQTEFKSTGVYGNIGNTHTFNRDWFSSVTVGAGDGGVYLPRYRVDAFINKKWLEDRQLITTLGLGGDKAMDSHSDASVYMGATYYFKSPWIVQGGIRFNDSNPGGVYSTSQFAAITQGADKDHFLTLRYGFGREAYQVVGPATTQVLTDFPSQQASLDWRQWVGDSWGFDTLAERYHNPNYNRTGLTLGIFKEF